MASQNSNITSFMLRNVMIGKGLPLQTRTESTWLTLSLRFYFGSLSLPLFPPFLREPEFFWLRSSDSTTAGSAAPIWSVSTSTVVLGCAILNWITDLDRPVSYRQVRILSGGIVRASDDFCNNALPRKRLPQWLR